MISSGAMAAVRPAAGAFAARRSASVRSAVVHHHRHQPLRANCVLPAPASTPAGLVRQAAARPAIFSVSRRAAVPSRCSAEPSERTSHSQVRQLVRCANTGNAYKHTGAQTPLRQSCFTWVCQAIGLQHPAWIRDTACKRTSLLRTHRTHEHGSCAHAATHEHNKGLAEFLVPTRDTNSFVPPWHAGKLPG